MRRLVAALACAAAAMTAAACILNPQPQPPNAEADAGAGVPADAAIPLTPDSSPSGDANGSIQEQDSGGRGSQPDASADAGAPPVDAGEADSEAGSSDASADTSEDAHVDAADLDAPDGLPGDHGWQAHEVEP